MKVWLDLCTPKDVMMLHVLGKEFKKRGNQVLYTTRKYAETNDLIDYMGIRAHEAGSHGNTREIKLLYGIKRMEELHTLIMNEQPDVLLTINNPEACRIAFGLGIPVVNFTDMPESDKVMRLTLPLSTLVYTPFVVPEETIRKYWDGPIHVYNCIDPVVWMPQKPALLEDIWKGRLSKPFVIYRPGETKASYYDGKEDISNTILECTKDEFPDGTFFEIPRYDRHKMIDMQSLLYYADLVLGGGATVNLEASWWGTWSLVTRPVRTFYDKWMEDNHLQYRAYSIEEGTDVAVSLLRKGGKNPQCKLLREQKFPLKKICDEIEMLK